MQTEEMVSVREYLSTSYRPDCDYVDGAVLERNVGEWDHARLQARVAMYLLNRERQTGIYAATEQRVQVKPNRFRIPDICAVASSGQEEPVLTTPPFICIEILSRDDRLSEMQERVQDYLDFGVPYVWILDPKSRLAWQCRPGEMRQVGELRTENPAILVPLEEIFA
jgi:Uma2 family endonuclease